MMKWTLYMVLGIFCLSALQVNAQDQPLTEKELAQQRLLIEGQKFFMLEQFDEAQNKFSDLIHEDQKNSAAIFGLSRIHFARKDFEEALRLVKLALEIEPENVYYLEHLISILKYKKDFEQMTEAYQRLVKLQPNRDDHVFELSRCYDKLKDFKSAIKVLEDLDRDQMDPSIAFRKASLYSKMGKEKKALQIYEALIQEHPDETRYLHVLANHYRSNGQNAEAIETYKRILAIDPDDSRAGLAIANSERNSGSDLLYLESIRKIMTAPAIDVDIKVKELIPFVQKMSVNRDGQLIAKLLEYADVLQELHESHAAVHALAADLHYINDDTDAAIEAYERSLAIEKNVYTVWEQYLYLLSQQKNYDKLLSASNEALDYFPNRAKVNLFYGLGLYEDGQFTEARSALQPALMMSGRDAGLRFEINSLLGRVLYKLDDYKGSDHAFDQALEIQPDHRDLLATYAYHLALEGRRLEDALAMSERAYKMTDLSASSHLAYAWVLAQKGSHEKALQVIEEGRISSLDNSAEYLERYGDILFLNGQKEAAVVQWEAALSQRPNDELKEKIQKKALLK